MSLTFLKRIFLISMSFLFFGNIALAKTSLTLKVNSKVVKKLESDIKKINSSIDMTRSKIKSASDISFLPDLYFMLAELLVDKSRLMMTLKKEKNPGAPSAEIDLTGEKRVLQDAIDTYKAIEDRYPNFADLDKVMFTMAHELRSLGDTDGALKVYKRIIDKFKSSKYYAGSIVEVGSIFFDKKDYEFALIQYRKVIELPQNSFTGIAYYKMGWCYIYLGKYLTSLESFEKVLKLNQKFLEVSLGDEFQNSDVREEALNASVWPYSELTPVEISNRSELLNPISFYEGISFDKVSFRRVLMKLAKRMELKKRTRDAADAYLRLFRLSDDPFEQKDAMENFYLQAKLAKLEYYPSWFSGKVASSLWRLKSYEMGKKTKKGYQIYEPLLRDVATSIHKTGNRTKRRDDLLQAVSAYEDYLWIFPSTKYKKEMELNLAEAAYAGKEYVKAGIKYLDLALQPLPANLQNKYKEILDSSIEAFTEAFKNYEELSLVERMQSRSAFRTAAKTYLAKYPSDKGVPTVIFNLAKSLYDEQKMTEAANGFRDYLGRYGDHELAMQAAVLLLDCYYIRDDIKGLAAEGERLKRNPSISNAIRARVDSVIQQAQLKKVRSVAGDFQTKAYAKKFLEFAKSNKGSSLGETALLEAFASFKSALDPNAYSVGEQFMGQYGESPKAKDLLVNMTQMALISTDYRRSAKYLLAFGEKYREDSAAKDSMLQGAKIFEQLGETDEAAEAFLEAGDLNSSARCYKKSTNWNGLAKVAAQLTGVPAKYYQGLASYKSGNRKEGIELLRRVLEESPNTTDEKIMLAHAGIIVSEADMQIFNSMGSGAPFTIALLQQKAAAFQSLDRQVQQVMSQGAGSWTLGSIYLLGQLNLNFASFLTSAKVPAGMNATQFSSMMQTQILGYRKSAAEHFKTCVNVGEENEIFSKYVDACRSNGKIEIKENQEIQTRVKAQVGNTSESKAIKLELLKNPRNTILLKKLAIEKIAQKDYAYAATILQRAIEISPEVGQFYADVGVCYLFMNQLDEAQSYFNEALKRDSTNGSALKGLAGLYKKFGYFKKFENIKAQFRGASPVQPPVHPWMM